MTVKFEKTDIKFIINPRGVIVMCTVTHVIEDNGEKKAIVTLPGEKFSYKTYQSKKARENHI